MTQSEGSLFLCNSGNPYDDEKENGTDKKMEGQRDRKGRFETGKRKGNERGLQFGRLFEWEKGEKKGKQTGDWRAEQNRQARRDRKPQRDK